MHPHTFMKHVKCSGCLEQGKDMQLWAGAKAQGLEYHDIGCSIQCELLQNTAAYVM